MRNMHIRVVLAVLAAWMFLPHSQSVKPPKWPDWQVRTFCRLCNRPHDPHSRHPESGVRVPALPCSSAFFSQETFRPEIDRKHDFCAASAAALDILRRDPSDISALRNALRGANVSSAWPPPAGYEPPGLLEGTEEGVVTDEGAMAQIFNELAKRAGFNWRDSYGIVEIPDAVEHENKTWNDLLMWSSDVYDVSVDWWIETPARKATGIFFPAGWFDASLMLVTKKKGENLNLADILFAWARPFSFSLWCLVLVTWVFAGVVYWIVEDGDLDGDGRDRNSAEFWYTRNWQNVLVSILNTALEFAGAKWHSPRTFAGRVFAFGWLFARLLLISSYTANLASTFITDSLATYQVESIPDAIARDLKLCYTGVVSAPLVLKLYPDVNLQEVNEDEMLAAISEGRCAGTVMSFDEWRIQAGMPEKNTNCEFTLVGRNVKHLSAGFAVQHNHAKCSWLVRDVLDLHLQEMTDEGFIDEIWSKHLQKMHNQTCGKLNSGEPAQMKPENTAGIFILMLITSVFAMALSSLELSPCALGGINQQNVDKRKELADDAMVMDADQATFAAAAPAARRADYDNEDRVEMAVCKRCRVREKRVAEAVFLLRAFAKPEDDEDEDHWEPVKPGWGHKSVTSGPSALANGVDASKALVGMALDSQHPNGLNCLSSSRDRGSPGTVDTPAPAAQAVSATPATANLGFVTRYPTNLAASPRPTPESIDNSTFLNI